MKALPKWAVPAGILAGGAFLVLGGKKRVTATVGGGSMSVDVDDDDGVSTGGAWSLARGVELPPNGAVFLDRLAAKVPGVPLFVTDGSRTTADQARVLQVKRELGDDLHALYAQDDLVDELLKVEGEKAMTWVLDDQVKRGRYLSRHMRKDALDLRSKTLTSDQVSRIMQAATELGAKPLFEGKPPHLHIERLG